MTQFNAIEKAVAHILQVLGEDPEREGLRETPRRVAELYSDLFSGVGRDPAAELSVTYDEGYQGVILLRDIPFYSICEHHLLPFFGSVHIAYQANGKVVGTGKLVRALEVLARRPQLQERLTNQLAHALFETLEAEGVAVVVKAEHLCMSMRGVHKPGAMVVTSITKGTLDQDQVLSLLQGT